MTRYTDQDAFVPVEHGYAVNWPDPSQAYAATNAILIAPDGVEMPLLVHEHETSFELAGSMGQSQMVRTFYPRNFVLTHVTVRGQSPNQAEYNRLGEFLRYCQRKNISTGDPSKLFVDDGGSDTFTRKTRGGEKVVSTQGNLRGQNKGFIAYGFCASGTRGGQFGQFAPEWEFDFVTARMYTGLYKDSPVTIRQLRSWADILKDMPSDTFVGDPDKAQADTASAANEAIQAIRGAIGDIFGGG